MSVRIKLERKLGDFSLAVDLELPGTGISAIFGHSGSGKSSLLRCVAGLDRAAGGVVEVNGEQWQTGERFLPPHQRAIGLVFQEASLFGHLSVRGNIEYGWQRLPVAERRVGIEQAVELLDIGPMLSRKPDTLSGGERQRVAIARALLASPRLLLMDEPLASLDSARKAEILPLLERLHAELSMPVLYVSHAIDEVARLADHLVLLQSGRALASGPLCEILSRTDLPLARQDDAAVVLSARVAQHDATYHLTGLNSVAGRLWVSAMPQPVGATVRVRVLARDVSLVLSSPVDSSILNVLPVRVVDLSTDGAGRCLVRLDASGEPLLARVTEKSVATLALAPGKAVFAQIKGVALL